MQTGHLFGAGRVAALEKRLLSRDDIKQMAEQDVIRILHDKQYGGENAGSDDEEMLIQGELSDCRRLAGELCEGSPFLYGLFLRADIQNLKLFIKLRLQDREIQSDFVEKGGNFEPKHLALMVKVWEFSDLPKELQKELSALDEELAQRKNPQTVSVWFDRAYYNYVRQNKDAAAQEYFGAECDLVNIITMLRMNGKCTSDELKKLLMPSYKIPEQDILAYFDGNGTAKNLTKYFPENIRKRLIPAIEASDAPLVQKIRDDYTLSVIRSRRSDMDTEYPVIWYYLARQREAEIIRMCANMRRCGQTKEQILEKVRELYG